MDMVKRRGTFYAPEGRPGNDGEWTFYGGGAAHTLAALSN
jgi:hypothetical protein